MKKHLFLVKISQHLLILCSILYFAPLTYARPADDFAISEHWSVGQQVTLRFTIDEEPETATPLHLNNGLTLTFADIISLGDLYGVIGRPISQGLDKSQKKSRFKEVFNSFAKNFLAVNEVNELTAVIKMEKQEIESGMEKGDRSEETYKRIGNEIGRQINCITGGGCTTDGWWLYPGRYLLLALENYDHFSPNNLIAYKSGHQIALRQALKAKRTGKRSDLELAYAIDAFALHFLADHFTAGYLRTPREALNNKVTPAILGSLLSSYMQSEENKYGIHVQNALGVQWVVYGDFTYLNPFNRTNQQMLLATLQQSADELFDTYYSGVIPSKLSALEMVPYPERFDNENNLDIAPIFYWDEQNRQLMRRTDLSNPYDKRWTNNWWGWSTLMLLKNQYKITTTMQLSLSQYMSQYIPKELKQNALA